MYLNYGHIERFHSHGQQPCKLIGTKESLKKFNSPTGLVWDTNMAAVLLFWIHTNVATVTFWKHYQTAKHLYMYLVDSIIKCTLYIF